MSLNGPRLATSETKRLLEQALLTSSAVICSIAVFSNQQISEGLATAARSPRRLLRQRLCPSADRRVTAGHRNYCSCGKSSNPAELAGMNMALALYHVYCQQLSAAYIFSCRSTSC